MRKLNIFYTLLFFGFIFFVFRNWFFAPQIIGGDWPYFFDKTLRNYSFFFSSWNPFQNNGLGGISPSYSLGVFHGFTVFLSQSLHLPWPHTYKISWFGLFIGLSIFSSTYLLKAVLPQLKFWQQILASMIFVTNTYILMIVSGGQMGIALAYSVAPLILATFVKLVNLINSSHPNFKFPIVAGLALSLQVMFDPRIAYLSMLIVCIYIIFSLFFVKFSSKKIFSFFLSLMFFGLGLPILVTALLHAVWILPILFLQSSPIPQGLINVDGFRFFSFADFSHAFSLLHPNWPENIFGKVGFMKSEFLAISIFAYISLLFMNSKLKTQNYNNNLTMEQFSNRTILFFALLGLMGAFLAKGANEPFSSVNIWLFENIPGFAMFRDPTKFYLLIALSYVILIPFSLYLLHEWFNSKFSTSLKLRGARKTQNYSLIILLLFFVGYWVFSIHPAILGQLGGTFKKHDVPKEYVELKDFLYSQKEYFRTLWVPRQQRFSFVSDIHPAIEAEPLFGTRSAEVVSKKLSSEGGQLLLSELSVKYVLIQYDSLGEQFLEDRKYSEKERMEYERKLDGIPWLKKIQSGKITVYETPFRKDHFFLSKGGGISSKTIDSMHYVLDISIDQPQILVFSESFNPHWILSKDTKTVPSIKTKNGLNSFWLDQKGRYTVDISFNLEKYYGYGRIISFLTVITLTICLIKLRKK